MNPSSNLFLIGPSGAGKSCIGKRLAAHYGLHFLDLDQVIESHTGVDITTIFEIEGTQGFRRRESALLHECSTGHGIVLATGAGAVLDPENRQRLHARGFVVWLQASVSHQLSRLVHDTARPLLAGDDREQRLQQMAAIRQPLYRELADLAVPGKHERVSAATARARTLIDSHWQRIHTEAA